MTDGFDRRTFLKQVAVGAAALAATVGPFPAQAKKPSARPGVGRVKVDKGYFDAFGLDPVVARRVLTAALSAGGDFADLFAEHSTSRALALEDGKVNRARVSVDLGVGVRVVKGDQTGFAYTEDLSPEALVEAAKTAAAIASGPARDVVLPVRVAVPGSLYDQRVPWAQVGTDRRKPLLDLANSLALASSGLVRKVRVSFDDEVSHVLIVDSDGRWVEDCRPIGSFLVACVAEKDGRREENWSNRSSRSGFETFDEALVRTITKEAVDRTLLLFDAVRPPPGEMPVVLAAGSSGILLHEAIGHGMEADFNRKGVSIFADKIGRRIAPDFVTIVDDGTLPGSRGALAVDDEGTLGQRTVLVENGVLRSYMHDKISARHYGVAPTGNGRRQSYAYPPVPRMRATYMLPGPHKKDEIIASVKKGIYAETFTNGQVQIGAGDFTFYIKTGYLIEDGKITRPIKDSNIIGLGPKVLESVKMVGDDLVVDPGRWTCGKDGQGVPVSQGLPTTLVGGVTVGGVKG